MICGRNSEVPTKIKFCSNYIIDHPSLSRNKGSDSIFENWCKQEVLDSKSYILLLHLYVYFTYLDSASHHFTRRYSYTKHFLSCKSFVRPTPFMNIYLYLQEKTAHGKNNISPHFTIFQILS